MRASMIGLSALALLASATPALAQDDTKEFTLTGSAAIVSDYRFRGISQSNKRFAVQASATLAHSSGAYISFWSSSIDDYVAARTPDGAPMPRLLIVIDEFAAMVSELPDFVTGLVDIARRGRSLGVHLVLATQRPAGVVSAEIKSNTNLRIALRVTDGGDSDDVIESSAAAQIPKVFPGRAYARLGHSSLIPFQSSRVGGRPAGAGGGAIRFEDMDWDHLPTLGRGPAEETSEQDDVSVPTDLSALVAAITEARDDLGLPPARKPWLEPLPDADSDAR